MTTTRYLFPYGAGLTSPNVVTRDAVWADGTGGNRQAQTGRQNSPLTVRNQVQGSGTDKSRLLVLVVTPPLAVTGPISGNISLVTRASSGSSGLASLRWVARVITSSNTVRSTLIAPRVGPAMAIASTSAPVGYTDTATFSGVTFNSGDMIQLELGGYWPGPGSGSTSQYGVGLAAGDPTSGPLVSGVGDTDQTSVPYWDLTIDTAPTGLKMYSGAAQVTKAYLGSTQVSKIYLGSNQL